MKNLYIPGTTKYIGYLDNKQISIYIKYFSKVKLFFNPSVIPGYTNTNQILLVKEKLKNEIKEYYIQLLGFYGYWTDPDLGIIVLNNCNFKIPDNLDLIEIICMYKKLYAKKR
jgi:hypothetical protein